MIYNVRYTLIKGAIAQVEANSPEEARAKATDEDIIEGSWLEDDADQFGDEPYWTFNGDLFDPETDDEIK